MIGSCKGPIAIPSNNKLYSNCYAEFDCWQNFSVTRISPLQRDCKQNSASFFVHSVIKNPLNPSIAIKSSRLNIHEKKRKPCINYKHSLVYFYLYLLHRHLFFCFCKRAYECWEACKPYLLIFFIYLLIYLLTYIGLQRPRFPILLRNTFVWGWIAFL